MNLLIASDIHVEFHRDAGRSFIETMPLEMADVVVLAGDIGTLRSGLIPALGRICARSKAVVFVTGNHEYYLSSPRDVHAALSAFAKLTPSFHWLNHSSVTVEGQRFVGTTLWFEDDPRSAHARPMMNDFHVIQDFVPWVFDENRNATSFLRQTVRPGDVVVTHHLPSPKCNDPKYAGSPLTPFFVCDVEDVIEKAQPTLWVHGHTHESVDLTIGSTRVVCNPFGYAGLEENPTFRERFIVSV